MLRYSIRWAGTADDRWVRFPNCQAGRGTWLTIDLRQIDFCWISLFHIWTVCIVLLVSHTNPDVCEEPLANAMGKVCAWKSQGQLLRSQSLQRMFGLYGRIYGTSTFAQGINMRFEKRFLEVPPKRVSDPALDLIWSRERGGDCPIDLDPGCLWGRSYQQFWLHFSYAHLLL